MRACIKCGTDLPPHGKGRPPTYCSQGCRRSTEYELRRIQRHLEALEREAQWLKWQPPDVHTNNGRVRDAVVRTATDIAELEARMRVLLDAFSAS